MPVQQECGNTCVTGPPAVPLPEEFKHLNNDTTCSDPKQLEVDTKLQASSNIWKQERAIRITSSNDHIGKLFFIIVFETKLRTVVYISTNCYAAY